MRSSPKLEFNIGATHEALGQLPEAAEQFELALSAAASANDAEGCSRVEQRLKTVRRSLGRVSVLSLVDGWRVLVDDKPRGTTPLVIPIYVRPGVHHLVVERQGASSFVVDLTIDAGEAKQVAIPSPPAPRLTPPASLNVAALPDDRPTEEHERGARMRRKQTLWGYSALGVAGALLGTSAVLFAVGASAGQRAKDDYEQHADNDETDGMDEARARVEAARTKLIVGDVLAGLGAAALGASLYVLLTRPEARPRDVAAAKRAAKASSVMFWAAPSGLGVNGSFWP